MAQPNKFFAAAALVCALVPASASAQTASSTTEILAPLPLPPVVPAMPDMVIPSFAEVAQTLPPSIPPPTASIAPFDPDARDLKLFVVINNSRQELTCAFRSLDGPWQPWTAGPPDPLFTQERDALQPAAGRCRRDPDRRSDGKPAPAIGKTILGPLTRRRILFAFLQPAICGLGFELPSKREHLRSKGGLVSKREREPADGSRSEPDRRHVGFTPRDNSVPCQVEGAGPAIPTHRLVPAGSGCSRARVGL